MGLTRRTFLLGTAMIAAASASASTAPSLAITMDDLDWRAVPDPQAANRSILNALPKQAALFVRASNAEPAAGRELIAGWRQAGHLIGNHTYSHRNYHSMTFEAFSGDVLQAKKVMGRDDGLFRFPMLKEGDTAEKRDRMRQFLREQGYRNGHVTIDASDWYYDARLRARLQAEPDFDVARYRQPYLDHLADRAQYYDNLARQVTRRAIPHTLLVHFNLINSLFLGDALQMFRRRGWAIVGAGEAFRDPVFAAEPRNVPAGESLVWALAKEKGGFELRYPGEDDAYEKLKLDRLGL